jgi:hypothetical protein
MTKREIQYHKRVKMAKLWGKIHSLVNNYTLAKLKLQQFNMRKELPPDCIYQTIDKAISELNQIVNK